MNNAKLQVQVDSFHESSRDQFSTGARGAPHSWFSETPILAPVVFFENLTLLFGRTYKKLDRTHNFK